MADKAQPLDPAASSAPAVADKTASAGLDGESAEAIFSALRNNQLLSGIMDGRDVSLIYIDRHKVQNYYTAEPAAAPVRPPAEGTVYAQRRIGDLVVNPVPRWEMERVDFVYQRPRLYDDALRRLRQQGLLILHGPAGSGKRATAIHLLAALIFPKGAGAIYELNPDLRLADLRADELPADTALLLETPTGSALAGLTRFQLDALSGVLGPDRRNNALVIVAEQLPSGLPREAGRNLLAWRLQWPDDPPAARRSVLAQHMRYLAQDSGWPDDLIAQIDQLVADPTLAALLAEEVAPGQLADLAELLLPVLQGSLSTEQALARFGQHAAEEVRRWFEQGYSADLESLLIAAAAFSGAPYAAVNEAAQTLASRLQPEAALAKPEEKPAQPASLIAGRNPRRRQLEAIHARLTPTALRSHYGDVQEEVVELENPAWQEAVLRYMWEFDDLRPPLLEWLQVYGVYGNHHLRTRAAAAIGALARDSFSLVEEQVLRRWADSADPNVRRSAAQILGITIWDETHSAASARLLHYWASQSDKPRWQWTAAAAYAGLAGPRYPQQTLADLKLISERTHLHPALLDPLFRALVNFYAAAQGMPDRRLVLLQELAAWSVHEPAGKQDRASSRAVQRTAVLGFWVMLWPQRDDPVWSLLLADAGAPGAAQEMSVQLMRRALNFRQPQGSFADDLHPRRLALDGLHRLVLHVARLPRPDQVVQPQEPDQAEQLKSLLKALTVACRQADMDEWDRLRYAAEQWQDAQKEASQFLDTILSN